VILAHSPATQLATFESKLKEKMAMEREQREKEGAGISPNTTHIVSDTSTDGFARTAVVLNVAVDADKF
jgi:hypothetical protein